PHKLATPCTLEYFWPILYQWRKYSYGRLVARRRPNSIKSGHQCLIMRTVGDHKFPHFYNYPPYFTLQPVRETREKQIQLWKELILDYCRTQKIFVIGLEQDFPLFSNPAIETV
nr:vacuolar protein sorting-associated protein 25 [Tanacetum cinerariifolium]